MKIRFGIVGCGFLGNIVANAWKDGFLEDYELVGVTSRSQESRDKTAAETGCRSCRDLAELLSLEPEYIVRQRPWKLSGIWHAPYSNTASASFSSRSVLLPTLPLRAGRGDAARRGCAKVHLANGAIGGFDVLQTITLMAQAGNLDETAGIETHTGARGFRNTPVWAEHLLTDTEKDDCLYRQRQGGDRNLSAPRQRRRRHLARHDRTRHHAGNHALRSGLDGR